MLQSDVQIGDDQATLSLAQQIGMKGQVLPYFSLPFKQKRLTISKKKQVQKYLNNSQLNKSLLKSPRKIQTSESKPKGQFNDLAIMNCSKNRLCLSNYKNMLHERGEQNQQLRVQTARTSFCLKNKNKYYSTFNQSQLSSKRKSAILENKNLLNDLWNEQKLKTIDMRIYVTPKIKNFKSEEVRKQNSKMKKVKKRQVRVKYNPQIKSFQFC